MTLGRLGRPQESYVSALWHDKDKLTPFGLAFLGVAVSEGAGDKSLQRPILEAIKVAATEKPLEAYYDGNPKGGASFDSPLRTHAGALLAYAAAGTAGDDSMSGKLLTGLLGRQRGGMWGNTQENVFGIMAVARIVKSAGGDKPALTIKINGKPIDASKIHDLSARMKRLELSAAELGDLADGDQLVVEVANAGKPVYATARLSYIAKLDAKNRAPHANGFTVTRRYEAMDGSSLEHKHIKLASLVRVRLQVTAAAANHYVAIDDKLPAGLEPLNAALATTGSVDGGKPTPAMTKTAAALSYSELRDARVAFYIDDMAPGSYEMVYVARATTPGHYIRPAATAEAMYQPDVNGASGIDDITVE
jgi:uncharacterized protein YfaS (alpha-2-macroglobulin family)